MGISRGADRKSISRLFFVMSYIDPRYRLFCQHLTSIFFQNCIYNVLIFSVEFKTVPQKKFKGAPVAQWVKRWLTDLADRVQSALEVIVIVIDLLFYVHDKYPRSCWDGQLN